MKKYILCFGVIFFASFISIETSWAVALVEPSTYTIIVKRIEASNDGGASFIPVVSGNTSFTITSSQSSGQVIGSFSSVHNAPTGVYTHIRVTLSNAIRVAGNAVQNEGGPNNGDTVCTGGDTGGGCTETTITSTITNSTVTSFGLSLPGNVQINDSAGEIILTDASSSFEIGANSQVQQRLIFNVTQALVLKFFGGQDRFTANIPSLQLSRS